MSITLLALNRSGAADPGHMAPDHTHHAEVGRTDPHLAAPASPPRLTFGPRGGAGGAPMPDEPPMLMPPANFSAADLVDLLRALREKSQGLQAESSITKIQTDSVKLKAENASQLQQIKDWIDKTVSSENLSGWAKFLSVIGKILAVVAAVVVVAVAAAAIVGSGGMAAPLMVMLGAALITAGNAAVGAISQACGGPPMSLGSLLTSAVSKLLEGLGVDKAQAERAAKLVVGSLAVAIPVIVLAEPELVGNMAASIAEMAGMPPEQAQYVALAFTVVAGLAGAAFTMGTTIINTATKVAANIAQRAALITAQIGKAAVEITQGGVGMAAATDRHAADSILARKKDMEAAVLRLQMEIEQEQKQLQKVVEDMEASMALVSKTLGDFSASLTQIVANVGRRAAV